MPFARKDLGKKSLTSAHLPGQAIDVSAVQLEDDLVVYEITATIGSHTETQRHSIGAGGTNPVQGGPGAPKTALDLQSALDAFRQQVADNVAWKAAMESAANSVG